MDMMSKFVNSSNLPYRYACRKSANAQTHHSKGRSDLKQNGTDENQPYKSKDDVTLTARACLNFHVFTYWFDHLVCSLKPYSYQL